MRFADGFPGRPRKVEGGIKARSARGAIGDTWWSKAFIGALESFADKGRLTRGRSYARAGQVISLEVRPGLVTAKVQGSRAKPYDVRLGFAEVPEPVWQRIEQKLAAQARFAAHLLAGEVPHELAEVFYGEGVPLFPTRAMEVSLECTCPDWGWPCKHVAAACYLLAERFDDDPFALLLWRGRSREQLLGTLRELRSGSDAPALEVVVERPGIGTAAALAPPSAGEVSVSRWWSPPVPLPDEPPAGGPDVPAARQLAAPPTGIGGADLAALLTALESGAA